jgi:sugar phosphate isomerase/epimerase
MTGFTLSTLATSLPLDFVPALRQIQELGFAAVDVVGLVERPAADQDALAGSGLFVSCVAVGKGLAPSLALDALLLADRRAAVEAVKRQLADGALLGARWAYLVCGTDGSREGMARFTEACTALADHAAAMQVCLCVEHVPGRALPRAADVLAWLRQVGHHNLRLLLDVGHCLISGEEPAEVIRQAGSLLGYVHLDDNDGIGDLHWPLLSGRLTEKMLQTSCAALRNIDYKGALSLELSANNAEPVEALRLSKQVVERLLRV